MASVLPFYSLVVTVIVMVMAVTLWDLRQRPPGRHSGRSNVRATIARAESWSRQNPVLAVGQRAYDTSVPTLKFGYLELAA